MSTFAIPSMRLPVVKGAFGKRVATYSTQIPIIAIESLLQHDPRSKHWDRLDPSIRELYEYAQRSTKEDRLAAIREYLQDRCGPDPIFIGAFPAISIVSEYALAFEPFDVRDAKGAGSLLYSNTRRERKFVGDGLGRVSAAFELAAIANDESTPPEVRDEINEVLESVAFPVVIYAPAEGTAPFTKEEMGQIFFDFNFKAIAIPAHVAIALDKTDAFIQLANRLSKLEVLTAAGGVEQRAKTVGKKSTAILTQEMMLRLVRGALGGMQAQESNKKQKRMDVSGKDLGEIEGRLSRFLRIFAETLGPEKMKERTSFHLSSPGWQSLGIIFNDAAFGLGLDDSELDTVAQTLGSIDWRREAPMWSELHETVVDRKTGQSRLALSKAGRNNRQATVDKLRAATGLQVRLNPKLAA